jgi:hypothetical protein
MNSNGDFPRRHRDTRDRSRIMRRLGFRADSSATEQQNTGRVPSSELHKNHRERSTNKRDRSREENYSHALCSRNRDCTNFVSSQRPERKQREDDTSSSSSRSSSPYSAEDTTHSRKHRRHHHRHRRRRPHGSRRQDRSYSPQHDNHQDAHRSGEKTTYAANISSSASATSFHGFAMSILRILICMDPFRWVPRFAKMDAKAIQKQIMDVGYSFSLVNPTEKESFGDSLVGEAYKSLQHLRPDDQCLYRVVISQRRDRAIFANVQSSLHPSPSQAPRAFWRYQKENDLVHPGSRVYLSPSPRMHMELPSLGGIVVPYRLPGSISELTNMEYQQPVVRGVTRDTKPMTSEQYVTQISVPPPQTDTSAQHKRCPSVRHFVPLEPLSTFLRALEASTLSEMGHSYRSLQRVLRTPYFVTDTQFVSYWEHKSTHQNMFPRYTLEKAFTAKEKVFDDLYVLWYILTHGPSDETQSFSAYILTCKMKRWIRKHQSLFDLPTNTLKIFLTACRSILCCKGGTPIKCIPNWIPL